MKQNVIIRLVGTLLLSILIAKSLNPFVLSHGGKATLTEAMAEQQETKGKEGVSENSLKEYLLSDLGYHFFKPSVLLIDYGIVENVNFLCKFFPAIPTPPPNH